MPIGKTELSAAEAKADGTPARPIHEPAADESIMMTKNQKKKKGVTKPTGQLGGRVMGEHPKPLPHANKGPHATDANRGITRENEAAEALAGAGYKVNHQGEENPYHAKSNPDLVVEGRHFEVYSPKTDA